ncbi:MAG: hypothetical protein HYU28_00940 [Actinobacteria bacterium]|nr:hypothetical protein [Actinomycetota bacterium]
MLAQQFIDSSNDGGGAFLLFAVMCFVIVGILFAVDHVRRKATGEDESEPEA